MKDFFKKRNSKNEVGCKSYKKISKKAYSHENLRKCEVGIKHT